MTWKTFNRDVATAITQTIDRVSSIKKGNDEGQVDFMFSHESLHSPVAIQIAAARLDDYPRASSFLVFTECENLPPAIEEAIGNLSGLTVGKTVADTILLASETLTAALEPSHLSDDTEMMDAGDWAGAEGEEDEQDDDDDDDDDDEEEDEEYDSDMDDHSIFGLGPEQQRTLPKGSTSTGTAISPRFIEDLQKAKKAGFEVGLLTDMDHDGGDYIFSLSIMVDKLCVSEETLDTWDMKETDFLVLLFRVNNGYPPLEQFINIPPRAHNTMQFRFGKCARFKPTLSSATAALSTNIDGPIDSKLSTTGSNDSESIWAEHGSFMPLYMSNSIDRFMRDEFACLLKTRLNRHLSWDGAINRRKEEANNSHIREKISKEVQEDRVPDDEDLLSDTAPKLLNQDYVRCDTHKPSISLIAIQFALRYFVKSTQYCMVCHQKSGTGFQAIKPFVCNNPLCLFQLINYAFGPSIEHEIISQPYVVDVLVSFCYAALRNNKLREYPKGIHLMVPLTTIDWPVDADPTLLGVPIRTQAQLNEGRLMITQPDERNLRTGEVVVLIIPPMDTRGGARDQVHHHCRIKSAAKIDNIVSVEFEVISSHQKYPVLSNPVQPNPGDPAAGTNDRGGEEGKPADMFLYERDFDDMAEDNTAARSEALIAILQTLPSIRDMREYLLKHRGSPLSKFSRISDSAMSLLRWIVASNRSFIVQLDAPAETDALKLDNLHDREHEKVSGLDDSWMQFRFAQGSPEKEQRFNEQLKQYAPPKTCPTIFAWHGSNLGNWHSIIRTGLDDKVIQNGRAYGNGVYFSPHWTTSIGYSGYGTQLYPASTSWPGSELKINSAIGLCEILNRVDKFVSTSPHYVVNEPDWIKCRYLFVQKQKAADDVSSATGSKNATQSVVTRYVSQDPSRRIFGPSSQQIEVPIAALPVTRSRQIQLSESLLRSSIAVEQDSSDEKDDFNMLLEFQHPEQVQIGRANRWSSVETATSTMYGESPSDCAVMRTLLMIIREPNSPMTPSSYDPTKTTFRPGMLNVDALPKLSPPTWADDQGLGVLSRELRRLQRTQSQTPVQELGWYIDFESITNMFQWIVELHSFEESLPLTQDMLRYNVTSIVLEVRFGRQYPMSPPFVRVIRPRFLPYAERGGGHVTAGGAMCMELLTNSGWSPANSMESVLMQVRMALCNLEPFPARLKGDLRGFGADYSIGEALEAYKRAARAHGWQIPPDLDQTALAL